MDFFSFVLFRLGMSEKICTINGTWYVDPDSGMEWTKYTTCLDLDVSKVI